jgi:uridine monophosphate synthetase
MKKMLYMLVITANAYSSNAYLSFENHSNQVGMPMSLLSQTHEVSRVYTTDERDLIIELYDSGVIRFDMEQLTPYANTDISDRSPYYADFRHLISHPKIQKQIIKLLIKKAETLSYDIVCGVPYAALGLAANFSYELDIPLIMRRSHRKTYGTCKKIEGTFKPGMRCLLIDDVITTGSSMLETIQDLEQENLLVTDCLVLFDRQQGGVQRYKSRGYRVHPLFTIEDFMNVLQEYGKIDCAFAQKVLDWAKRHQTNLE